MTIKSDKWIIKKCREDNMIYPFSDKQIKSVEDMKVVSYGVSSYGYDISLAPEMKFFTNAYTSVINPKDFDKNSLIDLPLIKRKIKDIEYSYFILPP